MIVKGYISIFKFCYLLKKMIVYINIKELFVVCKFL